MNSLEQYTNNDEIGHAFKSRTRTFFFPPENISRSFLNFSSSYGCSTDLKFLLGLLLVSFIWLGEKKYTIIYTYRRGDVCPPFPEGVDIAHVLVKGRKSSLNGAESDLLYNLGKFWGSGKANSLEFLIFRPICNYDQTLGSKKLDLFILKCRFCFLNQHLLPEFLRLVPFLRIFHETHNFLPFFLNI